MDGWCDVDACEPSGEVISAGISMVLNVYCFDCFVLISLCSVYYVRQNSLGIGSVTGTSAVAFLRLRSYNCLPPSVHGKIGYMCGNYTEQVVQGECQSALTSEACIVGS